MRAYLQRLFDHAFWADCQALAFLRNSPQGRPNEDARRLLAHVLAAERVWLLRLQGQDSAIQPTWPDMDVCGIEAMIVANRAGYGAYLETMAEADLARQVSYRNTTGASFRTPAIDILTHVALHGSYHRGQVAQAVRSAGKAPVNTDFITYVRELG